MEIQGPTYTVEPVDRGPVLNVNRMDIRPCVSLPVPTPRRRSKGSVSVSVTPQDSESDVEDSEDEVLLEEITPRPSETSDNETAAVPIGEVPVSIVTEYDPDNLEPEPVDDPSPRPVPAPRRSTR